MRLLFWEVGKIILYKIECVNPLLFTIKSFMIYMIVNNFKVVMLDLFIYLCVCVCVGGGGGGVQKAYVLDKNRFNLKTR